MVIFKIACTMYSLISRIELETIVAHAQSSTNITKTFLVAYTQSDDD